MSTLAATNLKHASSASNNIVLDSSGNATFAGTPVPNSSFLRNRIINGDMRIDQRNAGASVTMNASVLYTVDRWFSFEDTDGVMTAQQITSAPSGFSNATRCTTTTADASLGATQRVIFGQRIEGFNVADLGWGTASAQTVTLSFWVRSSLTGTFGGSLSNVAARSYAFTYTISAANTWEQKTVTIPGDTSGTWNTTSSTGIQVVFGLGVGSTYSGTAGAWAASDLNSATGAVSVIGTLSATWDLTGVQLEVGTAATPFERRQYGQELALCQRYYENVTLYGYFNTAVAGTYFIQGFKFSVTKRTSATMTFSGMLYWNSSGSTISFTPSIGTGGTDMFQVGYNAATNACGVSGGLAMASAEL
jgi:hypothetical protein